MARNSRVERKKRVLRRKKSSKSVLSLKRTEEWLKNHPETVRLATTALGVTFSAATAAGFTFLMTINTVNINIDQSKHFNSQTETHTENNTTINITQNVQIINSTDSAVEKKK